MKFHSILLIAVAIVGISASSALQAGNRRDAPTHWARLGRAAPSLSVPVTLALTQRNTDVLQATCDAVSDPDNDRYGQYMTQGEVADLISPTTDNVKAVISFASDVLGAEDVTVGAMRDFVSFNAQVAAVEKHFGVELLAFNPMPGVALVRSERVYTMPQELIGKVDLALGISDFPPALLKPRTNPGSAAAEVSAAGDSKDAQNPPAIQIGVVTSEEVFLIVAQTCKTGAPTNWPKCGNSPDPIVSYNLKLSEADTPNGPATTTINNVNYDSGEIILVPGSNVGFVMKVTGLVKPFKYYNASVAAVSKSGAVTSYATVQVQLDTMEPNSYPGLLSTPLMTPTYLGNLYGLPTTAERIAHANAANQSVAEFGGEFYTPSDLTLYQMSYDLPTSTKINVVGPNNASLPGIESSMDIQIVIGVAPAADTTFWSVPMKGDSGLAGNWVLEWARQISDMEFPPLVTSISYGLPESLVPVIFPPGQTYYSRTNTELLKSCARGLSTFVCAQDAGATDDGHGTQTCKIDPVFPATSPYATAVGSTIPSYQAPARPNDGADGAGEAVISMNTGAFWTGGGGFSGADSCRRPAYQDAAVTAYLSKHASTLPPAGTFNSTGRGYPDVSSVGTNWPVYLHGYATPIGDGTSSSTPYWAGITTLLNQARLAAGKPAVGFANPLFYKIAASVPSAFYDVTVGANNCGATLCCPSSMGYAAVPGWDAASGLGSVGDYQTLLTAVLTAAE